MKYLFILLLFNYFQTPTVPYKNKEEFELKLDYKFKQRPPSETNKYDATGTSIQTSSSVLPYLVINLTILKAEEARIKVSSNAADNVLNKKLEIGIDYKLDLGYTNDIKDGVTANEYTILLMSAQKVPVNKIIIFIAQDGSYFVNGEKRGRL